MSTITVSGTVNDGVSSAPFSFTVTTDTVALDAANSGITPANAPPGTTRTLKLVASSSGGLPLTVSLAPVSGVIFTPVSGQPPGTFVWTFIY